MASKIESLFPTLVSRGTFPGSASLNRKLLTEIEDFRRQDKMGREWSKENYRGGYTSYASLSDMQFRSPLFSNFAEALQPHANAFAKAHGWQMKGLSLEMNACWINVMARHTYHSSHVHPHSVLSGTYYVSTPKGSVALKLEDPRSGLFMHSPARKSLFHDVTASAGTFVLFESWLRHEVPPNQSAEPRISISFNYSLEVQD